MKTRTQTQSLEMAIENAILAADLGASIEAQVRLLIVREKELIDALTPEWQFQRVLRMFRSKRAELASAGDDNQYLLPGFERLPRQIVIRGGKRRPLEDATYRQLRDYLENLHRRQRNSPRIVQVKALMELVWNYAQDTPGITVKEVCRREMERRGL